MLEVRIYYYSEIHDEMPQPGKEDEFYAYKKINPLRTAAMIALLFQIVFSKPQWCKDKGQGIDVVYL